MAKQPQGLMEWQRNKEIQKAAGNLDIKGIVKVLGSVNRAAQLRLKESQGTITYDEKCELDALEHANDTIRYAYQLKVRKERALKDKRAKEWADRQEKKNAPPSHTLSEQLKKLLS